MTKFYLVMAGTCGVFALYEFAFRENVTMGLLGIFGAVIAIIMAGNSVGGKKDGSE